MFTTVFRDGHERTLHNWLLKQQNVSMWDNAILQTYEKLMNQVIPSPIKGTNKVAVIVEPRNHVHLEYCIRNILLHLGVGWSLMIWHSDKNKSMVNSIVNNLAPIDSQGVILENLKVNDLTIEDYNLLLLSKEFWDKIPAEHCLIFQCDSLMRKTSGLDEFMHLDYVGAPWQNGPHGLKCGNGGISFRKKSAMLKAIQNHSREQTEPEDVFFSRHVSILASEQEAMKFSSESRATDSICIHPDHYSLSQQELIWLLQPLYLNCRVE